MTVAKVPKSAVRGHSDSGARSLSFRILGACLCNCCKVFWVGSAPCRNSLLPTFFWYPRAGNITAQPFEFTPILRVAHDTCMETEACHIYGTACHKPLFYHRCNALQGKDLWSLLFDVDDANKKHYHLDRGEFCTSQHLIIVLSTKLGVPPIL